MTFNYIAGSVVVDRAQVAWGDSRCIKIQYGIVQVDHASIAEVSRSDVQADRAIGSGYCSLVVQVAVSRDI